MIIAAIGATGNLGRDLLRLGVEHGHQMRCIAPDADESLRTANIIPISASSDDEETLIAALAGADAATILFPPSLAHPERYSDQIKSVLACAKTAGVSRVVGVVGSSGALTSQGAYLVDTDYFQETTRHFYQNVHASWDVYRGETELDWVAIVPAARMQTHMKPRRTYRFRTDGYLVVTDENSMRYFDVSQISYADCALAILDEIEQHRHSHAFVCLGY